MLLRVRSVRVEMLESRCLLSAGYVVYGVSDFTPSQPFMHYYMTRTPGGAPIQIDDGLGGKTFEDFSIPAYLDTGTSGMILDQTSVQDLGIKNENYNGGPVVFNDIGIGGGQSFTVSEPLYMGLAPNNPHADVNNPATYQSVYTQTYGTSSSPLRLELNPQTTYDPNNLFAEPTNILGMPFMMGKVVVMDPTPVFSSDPNTFGDMNTYIYNPGTPYNASAAQTNPGIPPTGLHVQLSYADFLPFTTQYPPEAPGPTFAPNPFIGPNPIHQVNPNVPAGNTPPLSISFGARNTNGSFLFDTGAQISFISRAMAANLHVHYQAGTYGTTAPVLVDDNGDKIPNQQPVQIQGTDGTTVTSARFILDSLTVQTVEGTPITFTDVPVLVQDVSIQDPSSGKILTLDGDFGANMMFGSDSTGQKASFNWVTFDQPNGLLGFAPVTAVGASAAVVGRYTFYNHSAFDGNNVAVNAADDNAIALDKRALTPGDGLAFPANYTSYSKGINGIMIDVVNLPVTGSLSAADFTFLEGNSNTPAQWTAAPAPSAIVVRPGAGLNGSTRIELTWPDGAIRNQWLQVTLKADANTALPITDVLYFGNLVGSSGQPAASGSYSVSDADMTAARNDLHNFMNPAPVTNMHDYNRDGRVDAIDQLIARANAGQSLIQLNLPAPPPAAAPSSSPAKLFASAFHPGTSSPAASTSVNTAARTTSRNHPQAQLRHAASRLDIEHRAILLRKHHHFHEWGKTKIRPAL